MSHNLDLVHLRHLSGPKLQQRLLAELDDLFMEIDDGAVKENTFSGCIALGQKGLPPLNGNQSKQIKEILTCAPVTAIQLVNSSLPVLSTVFRFIRSLWGSHDTNAHPAQDGVESDLPLLDQAGRVQSKYTSLNDAGQNSKRESREIQQTDVKQFFADQGKEYAWVLPYAWDIANKLNAVKKSDAKGDLSIFLERRRKLNVQRPNATRFEQSVQRYAAKISELYCDDKGNITNEKSLEAFIRELVTTLLNQTKAYWPTSPLLAIFDGMVATVMRPLLHKHRTVYFQNEMTTATGIIVSGSTMAGTEQLVTTPKWNEESQKLVVHYVEKALKAHVWSLFMDRFASFNRDYSQSPHLNAASLTDVGLLMKSFGDPVHLSKVMELLQPTDQADELAQYVSNHFRSDDFIDH